MGDSRHGQGNPEKTSGTMKERCKNCGEVIHQNQFDHIWRHWDSSRDCFLNPKNYAEPDLETPDNIELGGFHD